MIVRLSEFRAKAERRDDLKKFLTELVQMLLGIEGCTACQLLESQDDPQRFVMNESWDSVEAHHASLKDIPPDAFADVMTMLDGMPKGEYFKS